MAGAPTWVRRTRSGLRLLLAVVVLWCCSSSASAAASSPTGGNGPNAPVAGRTPGPAAATRTSDPVAALPGLPAGGNVVVPLGTPIAQGAVYPGQGPGATTRRFIVLGDSLSAWAFAPGSTRPGTKGTWPSLLAGKDARLVLVKNAAIPANTTTQMLARLGPDVLAYNPDLLLVLGGTNDVGTNVPEWLTLDNLRRIVETAKGRGITVVLLNTPPVNGDSQRTEARRQLNRDLMLLAQGEGIQLVDVAAALSASDGSLAGLYAAFDGIHLSLRGEQVVADTVYLALYPPAPPAHD